MPVLVCFWGAEGLQKPTNGWCRIDLGGLAVCVYWLIGGLKLLRLRFKLKPLFSKKTYADVHRRRIIKGFSTFPDFIKCFLCAKSRTIRPVRRYSLDNISYSQDSCLQENVFTP